MRAALRFIQWNESCDWETFAAREPSEESWGDCGWFTVEIGPDDAEGADLFYVAVSTPAAKHRVLSRGGFRGLVVESFDPESVEHAILAFVESATGSSWREIVEKLQVSMQWEYEGM